MTAQPFDPGPLADATSEPADPGWTLVFIRELRHAPERVWRALTDPDEVAAWSPYTCDRDLGRVGAATLTMVDAENGPGGQELAASVRQSDAPRLLEYAWGTDVVRWELEPTTGGTKLTLRRTIADRGTLPGVAAGWHLCLTVAERLLDGMPINPIRPDVAREYGWDGLNEAYAERLGIPSTAWPEEPGRAGD